jgi:CDP-diacylglycerol--glycerol-3-phosphate 3-phosphatidyltransferase
LLPAFGWGNGLTIVRGILVAGLAGFLFSPRPEGWVVWLPAILYTLSNATDFFDGFAARRTNHVTRLGEILDMSLDGTGVLVAAALAVQYGQVPVLFLGVALVRYVFLGGMWLRARWVLDHEMPGSISRQVFAGLQMGFWQWYGTLFSPPGTHVAA